ncbi:MAG TPA: YdeI/OmpD-associated family protein [Acidobacteriota bacterium]|nr:YdeI/OmpD-associated family protein [Acidobacteriota bacterium]
MFFETPARLREWFEAHHQAEAELWVGFHKRNSGKPSITWPECVEEALCFGWIDGIHKSIDGDSYKIRLTPRKPRSIWSAVNTRLVKKLTEEGRMRPAGLKAFAARREDRTAIYSFEKQKHKLSKEYEGRFKANKKAWDFFKSQPPWYQRTASFWIVSAKKEETRLKRLQTLIEDSAAGRPIGPLNRKKL